ncbi:similar to Saccharomyces cerevisiae YMR284W YKU70 Subunit of the telomeric Ku complex (Yku70p-Yku80p), involved in telomere length maintenance, structure and telomere position effect [Maudiozyma barnettii]|uniref:ATP-dependent DNA helicase II subunit 1 n=1 Tax=Maudiozyma barnettii TaxID=61262 RepID=A0A8H2ZGB9_9SACH|nr:ATP-dependent DNA helicase YKU70 [Kazachstania barnettii]CAB4252620.1 similar to Saccharomyces cerevisiae YMR284W YKU70 Subunit of the telomeric Ku complex (Yku70p-Yku80p), involved in telomere length maintenance, structure and telomere position effect [Kazachstania barnettii]CAD1780079.1 similar to Saccharomyces cerevisiae YMR284W YKU70 Subunit of the telomeric Ku complex (Yku70p-Yku80p), involved in telomere length maintenance, structure and telomere position effect [Kazachstania barnettii]
MSTTLDLKPLEGSYRSTEEPHVEAQLHQCILYCIELTPDMFQSVEDLNGKVQLVEILESIKELMSQLVIVKPGTAIGCYLYHSGKETGGNGIYELLPLQNINIRSMKKLNDLLYDFEHGTDPVTYFAYDSNNFVPLETLFVYIQEKCGITNPDKKRYEIRSVFLFTSRDSPKEMNDTETVQRLKRIVDDMTDNYITFVPFFISSKETPFNTEFYNDVLRFNSRPWSDKSKFWKVNTDPISASSIKMRVQQRKELKRILFVCPLILNEQNNFVVGLRGNNILSHEKPGSRYKLVYEKEDVRYEAFSHRKYLDPATGKVIDKDGLLKVYSIGDLNVDIPDDKLMNLGEDVAGYSSFLKLICFRSSSLCIKYYNNIDKTIFISSDDRSYEGSYETLSSLFRTMKEKDKCMIVWGNVKSNSNPALYVMSPAYDPGLYGGFFLWKIPFVDEVRKFPPLLTYKNIEQSTDYKNLCKVTENIVNFLTLKKGYNPADYKNPGLQKHFKVLSDYILQTPVPDIGDTDITQEDDTLRKIINVRENILASASSKDPQLQRLHKYVNVWNVLYSKIADEEALGVGVVRNIPKRTKPSMNL